MQGPVAVSETSDKMSWQAAKEGSGSDHMSGQFSSRSKESGGDSQKSTGAKETQAASDNSKAVQC